MTSNESLHVDRTIPAHTQLYYDVDQAPEPAAPLLIALHGYGSNKKWMMREARQHAPNDFAVAAIQGPHQHIKEPKEKGGPLRYGFGWLTNFHPEDSVALHHRAILDLIEQLVKEEIARRDRIFVLGFSQTCALNFRFAFTHTEVLRGVVGICGGIPGDWRTSELYGTTQADVLYLHGTRDEFYSPERVVEYGDELRLRARNVEVKSYDAGHEFAPEMREDVREWLRARSATDQ
jgi:phospholipase/carboxylesterase